MKEAKQLTAKDKEWMPTTAKWKSMTMSRKHLTAEEKTMLAKLLKQHNELFSGGLGTLKVKPVHLELIDGAKPCHAKACPIPKSLERRTKVENGAVKWH